MFSEANIGCHYEVLNKFYTGVNSGVIYLPTKEKDLIPQASGELIYKNNSILIRGGVQFPLDEIGGCQLIPFLKLTYLID